MENNLENQLSNLLNRTEDVATRIKMYVEDKKKTDIQQMFTEEEENPEETNLEDDAITESPYKFIYLGYSYIEMPSYADDMKKELEAVGFLVFNPLLPVEQQFSESHREALTQMKSKLSTSELNFLKLDGEYNKPINEVLPLIRQADTKTDVDSMIFKELYFLMRSSVMVCDLNMEPYGPELYQKLFYAKLFEVPVIGIAPSGRPLSPYIFKYTKVLLTDSFNFNNLLPLVKAYSDSSY